MCSDGVLLLLTGCMVHHIHAMLALCIDWLIGWRAGGGQQAAQGKHVMPFSMTTHGYAEVHDKHSSPL